MASKFAKEQEGYQEDRFKYPVSENFKCSICLNVLKNAKSCGKNQHYFCLCCISQHLENSHSCPECLERLTPETLVQPQRLLLNCISELRIKCGHSERGCLEFVQLARLQNHEDECGYAPATCENKGCGTEINKKDKLLHETALCKYRKVECHGCEELKKQIEKIKRDQENTSKNVEEKPKEPNEKQTDLERKMVVLVEQMKNGVKGILDAEFERIFSDTQSNFRPPADTKSKQHVLRSRQPPINHDVIIIGGVYPGGKITNSVEKFCCKEGRWIDLAPMILPRSSASSVVFDNQVIVSGGNIPVSNESVPTDCIEMLNLDQLPLTWVMSDAKLPVPMSGHQTFVYKRKLIVFHSGRNGGVFEISLTSPHAVKNLSVLAPNPVPIWSRQYRAELINDDLFMFGERSHKNSNIVVVYNLLTKQYRQMHDILHPERCFTLVRGDQLIVLAEVNHPVTKFLKDVMMYDTETGGIKLLPPMTRERDGGAAVLTDDVIIVMGGQDNYVEFYDFHTNSWQAFKAMKYARQRLTAVISPL